MEPERLLHDPRTLKHLFAPTLPYAEDPGVLPKELCRCRRGPK